MGFAAGWRDRVAENTIPLLTCQTIQPIIEFYTALGFETTLLQRAPYAYVIVERGEVELHSMA